MSSLEDLVRETSEVDLFFLHAVPTALLQMESLSQHAISSAASAREACTRELTHVPIEAQLLAGHHIRGGYELAVDCATTRSSSRRSTRF